MPELLKQSFKIATTGTIAEGANLNIKTIPGEIKCMECDKISTVSLSDSDALAGIQLFQCKHCGASNTQIYSGKKANIKNIKIESPD